MLHAKYIFHVIKNYILVPYALSDLNICHFDLNPEEVESNL